MESKQGVRVSGRGWKAQAPAGHRPPTLPSEPAFSSPARGGQSQGLWRLQRPRRGCGRSRWPAHELSGHFSHEQGAAVHASWIHRERPKKTCSRGTGGLSDGGSAQGARAAAGDHAQEREQEREPAAGERACRRESLRVIQVACAEAQCAQRRGRTPRGRPPSRLENDCLLFVCLFKRGGGYCQTTNCHDRLNDDKPFYRHKHRCTHA